MFEQFIVFRPTYTKFIMSCAFSCCTGEAIGTHFCPLQSQKQVHNEAVLQLNIQRVFTLFAGLSPALHSL